jgi:hypothetical protein
MASVPGLALYLTVAAAEPVCHMHPPAADSTAPAPAIIGPYKSGADCEKANALMFAGQGRCHCAFDGGFAGNRLSLPKLPADPEIPTFESPMIP